MSFWLIILPLVGGVVSALTMNANSRVWYDKLHKPSWNPPSWVFGPVWTTLYLLMGVASFLVWKKCPAGVFALPMLIYGAQLLLNWAWSPVFFGAQNPTAALRVIVMLWILVAATIVAFWSVSPLAGALLLPYILWVTLATALNFSIVRLNPGSTQASKPSQPRP